MSSSSQNSLDTSDLQAQLEVMRINYEHMKEMRQSDRVGRIRAEEEARRLRRELETLKSVNSLDSIETIPLKPIGWLETPFTQRNGCPRQPHLVPASKGILRLAPHVPKDSLDGLQQYSHCWIMYIFHENTNWGKRKLKGKICIPRLNGGRMGCLASRTPHRPNPIGLSTARIVNVDPIRGILEVGGVDIVNGSPILDVKPYVPFADGLQWKVGKETKGVEGGQDGPGPIFAPSWVAVGDEQDAVYIDEVVIEDGVIEGLNWKESRGSINDFIKLMTQCLSRDIRSLHKRLTWQGNQVKVGDEIDEDVDQRKVDPFHLVLWDCDIRYYIEEKEGRKTIVVFEICKWQGDGGVVEDGDEEEV